MSDKKWTVYVYHFLDDDTRYVGKTSLTLRSRQGKNYSGYKPELRNKLLDGNFKTTVYDCYSNEEACYLEKYLILFYDTMDPSKGLNRQGGGDRGYRYSAETYQKMSETCKISNAGENNGMYGKHQSDETRSKMSESQRLRRLREKQASQN